MGFLNSVSIAQQIHRRIARLSLHGMTPHLGPENEVRKDRVFPSTGWLYRIYLDNFDALEKIDEQLATLIKGEVSVEALALRQGYQYWGLPRHPKKSVQQETHSTGFGLSLVNSVGAPCHQEGIATTSEAGVDSFCWGSAVGADEFALSHEGRGYGLGRLRVRCGGFCVSNGLTAMGVHAASCLVRGDVPEPDDFVQVLSIGLFDGIGSLRVACDVLKLPMGGHISSEVCCEGSRVLESHFPDGEQVGNVEHIDEEMVIGWAAKYSNVGVVVVGGGPPCQGVSGLNADRKGALRDARSSLFIHVRRVFKLCRRYFCWAQVHFLMESVFSMDEEDMRECDD